MNTFMTDESTFGDRKSWLIREDWKEDIIVRIKEKKLEKELQDMEIDLTKDAEDISQEFDNLWKDIVELDFDSNITMQKIDGKDNCFRKLTVLDVEYGLYITKNRIQIIAVYQKNKEITFNHIFKIIGGVGQDKYGKFLVEDDGVETTPPDIFSNYFKLIDFYYKSYSEILNNLMGRLYIDIEMLIEAEARKNDMPFDELLEHLNDDCETDERKERGSKQSFNFDDFNIDDYI